MKTHLKSLRKARGWSQQLLAEKLGLSQSRIVQIERNPESVSLDQLIHLFNTLGASLIVETDDLSLPTDQSLSNTTNDSTKKPRVKW